MRNCKKDGRLENVYINLTKEETNKLSEILKKKIYNRRYKVNNKTVKLLK